MLDAKIASALNRIIHNSHFKKKVSLEEQKAQQEDRFLRGRQIAFMIYDNFRVIGARDTVLDYADLFSVTLRDDDVQEFNTRWDEVLLSMSKIPSDDVLGCLYKLRIRESDQLKTVLELYDMEMQQKISMPNFQKLKTMVKRSIETPIANFDARHWENRNRSSGQESKGLKMALKEDKVYAINGEKKASVRKRDQCSFRHESNDHAPKPTPKTATLSEPSMTRGRSVSRKRSSRGKSQTGRILRRPCRYFLQGTCTRSLCEYWHPPECQFYKTESGC